MSDRPELPSRADAGRAGIPTVELPAGGERPTQDELPSQSRGAPAEAASEPKDVPAGGSANAVQLADRIRAVTAAGGLGESLPVDFGDSLGDWRSINADEPFERLYLDWRQAERITPVTVHHHYKLLLAFWTETVRRMQTGAAGQQIAKRYGGRFASPEMVKSYPGELEKAFHRLSDEEGIRSAYQERVVRRLAQARERLDPLVRQSLLDGELSPDEAEALLDEETADLVHTSLAERGFKPDEKVASTSPVDQLVGTEWRSAQVRRSPRARNAFKFEHAAVYTLAELAAACGKYPSEASGYLYNGYLERWLAGDLGLAALAAQVSRIPRDYQKHRGRGLEMFVRALLAQRGINAAPRMHADPSELDLGQVAQGCSRAMRLTLRELGGRYAWGRIAAVPEVPGFRFPTEFDGDETLDFHLDTSWLPAGSYAIALAVDAEGAAQRLEVAIRFTIRPLHLQVVPSVVHLSGRYGFKTEQRLGFTVEPSDGVLLGTAELAEEVPGLTVHGQIAGAETDLLIRSDSRRLRAGSRHSTELILQTNAGEVRLPVSVHVEFDAVRAGLWGLLGAGTVGMVMMLVRRSVADVAGEPRWILSLDHMEGLYMTTTFVFALVAAGIFLVRWIAKQGERVEKAEI
jgi:hypothetical protein